MDQYSSKDPTPVLEGIEATLEQRPDAPTLRQIRNTVDDAAFLAGLKEYLRSRNDPDSKVTILNKLAAIMRKCGDASTQRKNDLTNLRYGIGGGLGLVGTGIITTATVTIPGFFLIPVAAGAWLTFICVKNTKPLAEEEQIYKDISDRLARVLEKVDAAQ